MRCPKCNQKLPKGLSVCPSCGAPVKSRGKRVLWGTVFVFFFVLIVSAVLVFFNLKGRGDLPEFSFDSIRSIFVRDKAEPAADPTEEPADGPEAMPEPTEEPEPTAQPEPEPEAAEAPEPADEPEAKPAAESEPTAQSEPAAEPAPEQTAAEPTPEQGADTERAPLEAWRAAERESFAALRDSWAACRASDDVTPEVLLRGDARLLLRLWLNTLLGEEMSPRLALNSTDVPESWDLFSAKAAEANAAFLPLLASENFDQLLGDYLDLVLSAVEEISVGEEPLEAEGVLARCESFRVDLDETAMLRIASSLIGSLRWDERIGRILDRAEDYDAFLARLDELDYALENSRMSGLPTLSMTLYVDENGQFRGRSLRMGSLLWQLALPRDAETLGWELSLRDGEGLRSLTGRGILTEDAFRGSFRLLREGRSVAGILAELTE